MTFRELRKKNQLTQISLANLLGIKQSTVAMWERGASIPQTKDLKIIAQILNTSIENLIDCFEKEPQK